MEGGRGQAGARPVVAGEHLGYIDNMFHPQHSLMVHPLGRSAHNGVPQALEVRVAAVPHADEPGRHGERSGGENAPAGNMRSPSSLPWMHMRPGVCLRAGVRVCAADQHVARGEHFVCVRRHG